MRNDVKARLEKSTQEITNTSVLFGLKAANNVALQFAKTRLHILRESSSRSAASVLIEDGHGHYEILLPLRAGSLRLLVR